MCPNSHTTFPLVTIMIPTYCQEDVILEAVDSALAQDYANFEVIVADDTSPDRTRELVASRTDRRLRYHRNDTNLGRVENYRNTLYNLAQGDWVVNLDGDDYFTDPGFISAALAAVQTNPNVVIVAANCRMQLNGALEEPFARPGQIMMPGIDVLKCAYDLKYKFFHMATLYRRDKALALDFYRMDVTSADWESLYRLAVCGNVYFMNLVAGVWRISEGRNASLAFDDQISIAKNLCVWTSVFDFAVQCHRPGPSLFLARHRIQFSEAYRLFSHYMRSRPKFSDVCKFLRSVGQFASNMTMILLALYYKTACKLLLLFLKDHQEPRT